MWKLLWCHCSTTRWLLQYMWWDSWSIRQYGMGHGWSRSIQSMCTRELAWKDRETIQWRLQHSWTTFCQQGARQLSYCTWKIISASQYACSRLEELYARGSWWPFFWHVTRNSFLDIRWSCDEPMGDKSGIDIHCDRSAGWYSKTIATR